MWTILQTGVSVRISDALKTNNSDLGGGHEMNNCGSTLILIECYFNEASELPSPEQLANVFEGIAEEVGMHGRKRLCDVWEEMPSRPATVVLTLEESHFLGETWPDHMPPYIYEELKVCNWSRDNGPAIRLSARLMLERLDPPRACLQCLQCGPGPRMRLIEEIEWKRGEPLPFQI